MDEKNCDDAVTSKNKLLFVIRYARMVLRPLVHSEHPEGVPQDAHQAKGIEHAGPATQEGVVDHYMRLNQDPRERECDDFSDVHTGVDDGQDHSLLGDRHPMRKEMEYSWERGTLKETNKHSHDQCQLKRGVAS